MKTLFGVWFLLFAFIVIGVSLLVVTFAAQAEELRLTPEQEVAYRHSLDKEDIKTMTQMPGMSIPASKKPK